MPFSYPLLQLRMPSITLTNKQTAKCLAIVEEFVRLSDERPFLHPVIRIKLRLLRDMLRDEDVPFANEDFEFLADLLSYYFASFGEEDVDPLAEQAYGKLRGEWPILPPWYDRIQQLEHIVGFERGKQEPPLGT